MLVVAGVHANPLRITGGVCEPVWMCGSETQAGAGRDVSLS